MKKLTKRVLVLLAAMLVMVQFTGCPTEEDDPTVLDNTKAFIKAANEHRYSDLKQYTDEINSMYNLADAAFWENELSAHLPLELADSDGYVIKTADGLTIAVGYVPDRYKISSLKKSDDSIPFYF